MSIATPPGQDVSGLAPNRFSDDPLSTTAAMYYQGDANQAEVAQRLGLSRATVSRLLSEARRRGIVRIEVVHQTVTDHQALGDRTAKALDLQSVYLTPTASDNFTGASLAPGLAAALQAVGLNPGDILLVSSGRTIWEVSQAELPPLLGAVVAPMIGGQDDPEPWYQPNEIVRQFAAKIGGHPTFLYAPALPGPDLHKTLLQEASIARILELWRAADCAVIGVGAPPLARMSIPRFVPTDAITMREAVGDVCSRFFDRHGAAVDSPGSERLMSTSFDVLIPVTIAVAFGGEADGHRSRRAGAVFQPTRHGCSHSRRAGCAGRKRTRERG